MAKKRQKRAENLAAFAGPDADQETIERLAAAAQAANAKSGHNSGEPPDAVIKRNADAIELALIEINTAQKTVQKARAELKVARDTAKTDTGSKAWVNSIVAAVKLKLAAAKGGAGEIVTEHRQIGRTLRLLDDCPLGTQHELFMSPPDRADAAKDEKSIEAEATLAGEHAGLNGEPRENNPHHSGTPAWFGWNNGHQVGTDKLADGLRTGNANPATGASAH